MKTKILIPSKMRKILIVSSVLWMLFGVFSPLKQEVHAQAQSIDVFIRATDSFLHIDGRDSTTNPQAIDLQASGFSIGDELHFNATGKWCPWSSAPAGMCPETDVNVLGVFSNSGTVLSPNYRYRIPGAIDVGNDVVTGPTYYYGESTDIKEDFRILPSGFSIVIPKDAAYLFLGSSDSYYKDNSGGFNVTIFTVDKCRDFAIFSIAGTEQLINPLPLAGQKIAIGVTVGGNENPDVLTWTLTANDQLVAEGTGISDGVAWDGRNGDGKIEPGSYDLHLTVTNPLSGCIAEQDLTAILDLTDACMLKATFP